MLYRQDGDNRFLITDDVTRIGDARIGVARNTRWGVARGSVKLPTGSAQDLTGSGGVGASLSLDAAGPSGSLLGRALATVGGLGVSWQGPADVLDDKRRPLAAFGGASVAWSAFEPLDLKLSLAGHSPLYDDTALPQLKRPALQLAVGGSWQLGRVRQLDVALVENIIARSAPDVGFHFNLRHAFYPDRMAHSKLKLHGFNNLTKSLSFNIYDIAYAATPAHQREYIEYIDEAYNAERLTTILSEVSDIIGANILNVARQDYEPEGASVTMLISEGPVDESADKASVVGHLDKSHITVHTYPEVHPDHGISTFRADIDVSTCGVISPLKALNHLIHAFESDVVIMDYRVRGFTRNVRGRKHFIDHKIDSIQNFLDRDTRARYQMVDVNVYQENLFHTKMRLKEFDLDDYMFGSGTVDLSTRDATRIRKQVSREIAEVFYGRNITA